MKKSDNIISATYGKIAIDIAKNIADGKYEQGKKLFGRSLLASYYKVSPETIRKAVFILKDVGIVDTERGSGIEILSTDKAKEFIARFEETQSVAAAGKDIVNWAKKQESEIAEIIDKIKYIVSAADRAAAYNPFNPFEIIIGEQSCVLNKTIAETNFWQNTGATIIAIKRNDDIILSPGPYATFKLDDVVYFIGTEEAHAVAKKFIE